MTTDTAARRRKGPSLTIESGSDIQNAHIFTSVDDPLRQPVKRRKRRKRPRDEPPFFVLFLQVGAVLLLICATTYKIYRYNFPYYLEASDIYDDDDGGANGVITVGNGAEDQYEADQKAKLNQLIEDAAGNAVMQNPEVVSTDPPKPKTAPPIPVFELSEAAKYDVYDLPQTASFDTKAAHPEFWKALEGMKETFAELYGGVNAARMILDRAVTTFGKPVDGIPTDTLATACRLQLSREEKRPFRFSFGGYSVTTGRGNYFSQSFPFVMRDLLEVPMSLLGFEEMHVRNAAIGGCPAFPYGWCMENFWGEAPDVVSWDYSMNEAGGVPEGLEAYVRHLLAAYRKNPPKLLVKDTHMASMRREVLALYEPHLRDAVVIHTDPATEPFLRRSEIDRPVGFQNWRKFGAPIGAPGQSRHHPAVQEHILLGWLLAMHFLQALELIASSDQPLKCPKFDPPKDLYIQPPVSGKVKNTTKQQYPSVMFGHPSSTEEHDRNWLMRKMHCRTSYEPILSGDLTSIVLNGTTAEDVDLLLPKSHMFYNKGWTMDLSEGEKLAKTTLSLYNPSLGFLDNKKAYYGLRMSGTLRFLVPYESPHDDPGNASPRVGDNAGSFFSSVVVCEVNEKRDSDACRTPRDVQYTLGGVNLTNGEDGDATVMNDAGTLFMGKRICMHLSIPGNATLTSRRAQGASAKNGADVDQVGLLLEVMVKNHRIIDTKQACSVSHVVWEQQERQ